MRLARGDLNITFRQTDVASEIRVALRCKMWQRSRINAAEARPHGVHGPLREKPWMLRYGESEVPAKKKKEESDVTDRKSRFFGGCRIRFIRV